jgi:hypothetical protein
VLACGIIALTSPQIIVNLFELIPGYEYLQYYIDVTQAVLNNAILLTCIGGVIVVLSIIGCIGSIANNCFTLLASILTSGFVLEAVVNVRFSRASTVTKYVIEFAMD